DYPPSTADAVVGDAHAKFDRRRRGAESRQAHRAREMIGREGIYDSKTATVVDTASNLVNVDKTAMGEGSFNGIRYLSRVSGDAGPQPSRMLCRRVRHRRRQRGIRPRRDVARGTAFRQTARPRRQPAGPWYRDCGPDRKDQDRDQRASASAG